MPRVLFAFLFALPLFLVGCDSAIPEPITVTGGVLVASQGAFGADDGGLVVYDPETDAAQEVYGSLFVQSVAVLGGRIYLSSLDRVDVLDAESYARVGRYNDVPNPRYFAFDGEKVLVTNLFTNADTFGEGGVSVLGTASGAVEDTVILGGNPDGIAVVGDRVYVANYDFGAGRTVTVLDATTYAEIERVDVGCDGPRFVFADAQAEVVAVCTGQTTFDAEGNVVGQTNGAFVVLGGAGGDVVARANLPTPLGTASLGQDASDAPEAEEVVAVYSDGRTVYRFDTATNTLAATLDVGGAAINAVAYDALSGALYVGRLDPDTPFTAEGTVTIHDRDGALVGSFRAGVVPSHITFLRGAE